MGDMGYYSPGLAEALAVHHTHQLEGKNLVDLDTDFVDLDMDFVARVDTHQLKDKNPVDSDTDVADLDMDFVDLDTDFVARVDMAILDYIGQVQQIRDLGIADDFDGWYLVLMGGTEILALDSQEMHSILSFDHPS